MTNICKDNMQKKKKLKNVHKKLISFFINVETLFMRFTLDFDMFFNFLSPFSFIFGFSFAGPFGCNGARQT